MTKVPPQPQWWTAEELDEAAEKRITHQDGCGRSARKPHPAVVREAPERIRRFVAECMEPAPGERVSMYALRDAYDEWPGNGGAYAEYNTFGRWIRQCLPNDVSVFRGMINGDRQVWVHGMRLR